jgi:putative flippase GtrA
MNNTKSQVKNFAIIGGLNTLLDIGLSYCLVYFANISPVFASVCSTTLCFLISFHFNRKYTFKVEGKQAIKRQMVKFTVVSLFTAWVVQSAIIGATTSVFSNGYFPLEKVFTFLNYISDWQYLFAKCLAIGICMCINFVLYKKVVFKETGAKK